MLEVLLNNHGHKYIPKQYGDFIDLAVADTVHLHKGDYREIPLGVSMQLPKGYYAEIVARSSTFKKYGIIMVNGIGIIDNDYCGDNDEWCFPAYATRNVRIERGTRIAQFRLVMVQEKVSFTIVPSLDNINRGGLGSTGEK